ncbi:MAG: hypothetical protein JKY92_03655 [Magnetovibrio sp.]|nr:hypothetical protein [Magnetovibrio sp.]
MMKKTALILSVFLLSNPALAAKDSKVSVSLKDCQQLTKSVSGADVAYQPGVDVQGNPVVPAEGDFGATHVFKLPKTITIDFGIDLAGKYGISGTGEQTATAPIFKIDYDLAAGDLTVNGKPLTKGDSRAIVKACQLLLEGKNGGK